MGGNIMSELNDQSQDQFFSSLDEKRARRYKEGKIILCTIAVIQIINILLNAILLNFIYSILHIVLLLYLFRGVTWIKYFYAFAAALRAIFTLYGLTSPELIIEKPFSLYITIVLLVYDIAVCIILLKNKGVSEFLYEQKARRYHPY